MRSRPRRGVTIVNGGLAIITVCPLGYTRLECACPLSLGRDVTTRFPLSLSVFSSWERTFFSASFFIFIAAVISIIILTSRPFQRRPQCLCPRRAARSMITHPRARPARSGDRKGMLSDRAGLGVLGCDVCSELRASERAGMMARNERSGWGIHHNLHRNSSTTTIAVAANCCWSVIISPDPSQIDPFLSLSLSCMYSTANEMPVGRQNLPSRHPRSPSRSQSCVTHGTWSWLVDFHFSSNFPGTALAIYWHSHFPAMTIRLPVYISAELQWPDVMGAFDTEMR